MRLKNIWRILLILLILGQTVSAKENRAEIMVDFRVNVMRIDPAYAGNEARIKEIISFLRNLGNDSTRSITSVSFCGAASPEGSYELNRRLARGRLSSLERLVRKEVAIPDSIIFRDDSYIPWAYLRECLLRSTLSYKDTVISIIDESPVLVVDRDNGKLVDRRIVRLKQLDNRRVWKELLRLYFGKMRNASAVIITYSDDGRDSVPLPPYAHTIATEMEVVAPDEIAVPSFNKIPSPLAPFYMDVRSNLLFDALAVPNIGVEFYLGKNLSLAAGYMHAWWSRDSHHRYWRVYGGELTGRWWFGKAAEKKPLTGHHAGIYLQALTYDFEWGGKAYMGGEPGGSIFDRAHFGAGVEYGYSLPVARRLNIDFTAGVGYIGGRVYEFVPDNDRYLHTATKTRRWFGPTRLEVSLVWLIGHGNCNERKGGGR